MTNPKIDIEAGYNQLGDGTVWILPTRCASRFTAGLLWKYGLIKFSGHGLDIDPMDPNQPRPPKIVMNIRNPLDRFYSFWRLIQHRTHHYVPFVNYIWNLQHQQHPVLFTNDVPDVIDDQTLRYPVPMFRYLDVLRPWTVDKYVRVEHIDDDLEKAGYPRWDHTIEGDNFSDYCTPSIKEVRDIPVYNEIVQAYYTRDYTEFGYPL